MGVVWACRPRCMRAREHEGEDRSLRELDRSHQRRVTKREAAEAASVTARFCAGSWGSILKGDNHASSESADVVFDLSRKTGLDQAAVGGRVGEGHAIQPQRIAQLAGDCIREEPAHRAPQLADAGFEVTDLDVNATQVRFAVPLLTELGAAIEPEGPSGCIELPGSAVGHDRGIGSTRGWSGLRIQLGAEQDGSHPKRGPDLTLGTNPKGIAVGENGLAGPEARVDAETRGEAGIGKDNVFADDPLARTDGTEEAELQLVLLSRAPAKCHPRLK